MKYGELNFGQVEAVVNKLGGMEGVKRFLSGELVVKAKEIIANTLKLLVSYGRSVEEGVKAGKYDWANENINDKNFPSTQSGEAAIEVRLLHFNKYMSTDEVLRRLDEQGLRPATLPELLAIGERYPELQREFPIVALGSSWVNPNDGRDVACLYGYDGERHLYLGWCGYDWDENYRFAAVSK